MQTYIHGNFPVFEGFNHMQYQIRDPEGFARMLETIIEAGRLPNPVVKKQSKITSSLPKYLSNFPYFTGFPAHSLVK